MPRLLLLAALAVAACGADGAPEPPTKSGIVLTGEAEIGVAIKK